VAPPLASLPETITAHRTDPIYNCHGYLTKVPIAAIEPFIETFSEPGEVVADFFAGSGMTGLAAVHVGRKAVLSDISALGRHIARGYIAGVDPEEFQKTAHEVVARARGAIGHLYDARRATDGVAVEMVRTVWSFTYLCPSCRAPLVYYRHLSPNGAPPKNCPQCQAPFARRRWKRDADVPVEVVVRNKEGRLAEQAVSEFDLHMIEEAARDARQTKVPSLAIDEDREPAISSHRAMR
jgi:hypothetical protein